jgi:hypothetical protein
LVSQKQVIPKGHKKKVEIVSGKLEASKMNH